MNKSRLIVGILLMILGIGITTCSVYRHYENARYGMMNRDIKIIKGPGMMGGSDGPCQRGFNANPKPIPPQNPKLNPNQGQTPDNNPIPDQKQNQSQN